MTGNHSNTHGGGVLCNGYLVFTAMDNRPVYVYDRLQIDGSKILCDGDSFNALAQNAGDFRFTIRDAQGNVVSEAFNNANGEIIFDRMLPFTREGTGNDGAVQLYRLINTPRYGQTTVTITNTVKDEPVVPDTGDSAQLALWVLMCVGSAAALIAMKKRRAY